MLSTILRIPYSPGGPCGNTLVNKGSGGSMS